MATSTLSTYFCSGANMGKKSRPSTVVSLSSPASWPAWVTSCLWSRTSPVMAMVRHRTPGQGGLFTDEAAGAETSWPAAGVGVTATVVALDRGRAADAIGEADAGDVSVALEAGADPDGTGDVTVPLADGADADGPDVSAGTTETTVDRGRNGVVVALVRAELGAGRGKEGADDAPDWQAVAHSRTPTDRPSSDFARRVEVDQGMGMAFRVRGRSEEHSAAGLEKNMATPPLNGHVAQRIRQR